MEPVGADNKGAEGHHHGMGDLSFPSAVASALINHMLMCLGMGWDGMIWRCPARKMGVPQNGWFILENPI